jgi:hypothetical protein
MNFLDLHNQVLMRLREKKIVSTDVDSNPHIRMIGANVNDAKDAVENAWNWTSLRGEDTEAMVVGEEVITLAGSADNHYLYSSVLNQDTGVFLERRTHEYMTVQYANDVSTPVANKTPCQYAPYFNDATGLMQIRVYPRPDTTDTLRITRTAHQPILELYDDILLVPSLPVYSLATALASRERGEVGGSPVSELFAIADAHLSDAIALDSAKYPEELIWFNASNMNETNNRFNY